MTSRTLEIEAQFLYLPGCMVLSFDDSKSRTAEVKIVKADQGVDLGKLRDVHEVYKEVIHDLIGVEEATGRLDEIILKKPKFGRWTLVLFHGLSAVTVAPFAYYGRAIDLPLCFVLGCILGFLRVIVAPTSALYENVFEVTSVILTSFLARALGSINGGELFCFSAMAQSSITLILPGYTILCGALELQARSLIAGSVRMVYAVIYSLILGFAVTIGTTIYGLIDPHHATSETQCTTTGIYAETWWKLIFVPMFAFCLAVNNQAKWSQMPVMVVIAFLGFLVTFYAQTKFTHHTEIPSALAAMAVAIMANLYSRLGVRVQLLIERLFFRLYLRFFGVPQGRLAGHSLAISDPEKQENENEVPANYFNWIRKLRYGNRKKQHSTDFQAQSDIPGISKRSVSSDTTNASSTTQHPENEQITPGTERHDVEMDEASHRGQTVDPGNRSTDRARSPDNNTSRHSPQNRSKPPWAKQTSSRVRRVGYSLAATAMLPAIFVLVPSGLAISGSLVSGISTANDITSSATGGTSQSSTAERYLEYTVAGSIINVAIGITIGLFLGTLVVYPTGKGGKIGKSRKMRSGIFSF